MSNIRILLTGASGFVGAHLLDVLVQTEAEVHACSRRPQPRKPGVSWHQANLLDPVQGHELILAIKPSHLVHLAWTVEHGAFWTAPDNLNWLAASLALMRSFRESGGQRFLATGTCAEYGPSTGLCQEQETPAEPKSLYAAAKHSLSLVGSQYAGVSGLSFVWPRLFQVMGRGEPASRLIPSLTRHLMEGRPFPMGSGKPVRDFVDVRDVAKSLSALLVTDVTGPVNIASGNGRSIGTVCATAGEMIGRPDLLRLGAREDRVDEPARIVADVTKLRNAIGSLPTRPLEDSLSDVARWVAEKHNETEKGLSSI